MFIAGECYRYIVEHELPEHLANKEFGQWKLEGFYTFVRIRTTGSFVHRTYFIMRCLCGSTKKIQRTGIQKDLSGTCYRCKQQTSSSKYLDIKKKKESDHRKFLKMMRSMRVQVPVYKPDAIEIQMNDEFKKREEMKKKRNGLIRK